MHAVGVLTLNVKRGSKRLQRTKLHLEVESSSTFGLSASQQDTHYTAEPYSVCKIGIAGPMKLLSHTMTSYSGAHFCAEIVAVRLCVVHTTRNVLRQLTKNAITARMQHNSQNYARPSQATQVARGITRVLSRRIEMSG